MGAWAEPTPAGVGYPAQLTWAGRPARRAREGFGCWRCGWPGSGTREDAEPTGSPPTADQTVTALAGAGCEIRFFHHDLDGDRTPVVDAVSLEGVRFKTVTLPAPRTLARIERGPRRFPSRRRPLLGERLPPRRGGRSRGARPRRDHRGDLPPPLRPGSERPGRVMRRLYHYHAPRLQEYDRCIALSRDQRDLLVRAGVAPDRIVVMPNAVDTERICPGPSGLKQALGAELMISFLGRLDPEKRVEELIHSFLGRRLAVRPSARHRRHRQPGSPAPRHRRSRGAGALPRDGDEHGGPPGAAPGDRSLCPSLDAEGLSLALLEAMAAGCAIVATDAGEHGAVLDGAGLVMPGPPPGAGPGRGFGTVARRPPMPVGGSARRPAAGPSPITASTPTSRTSSASTRRPPPVARSAARRGRSGEPESSGVRRGGSGRADPLASSAGRRAWSVVPTSGTDRISSSPPASRARSWIRLRPRCPASSCWWRRSAVKPMPSSTIRRSSLPASLPTAPPHGGRGRAGRRCGAPPG